MAQRDITSMRSTIEFLKERNELLTVKGEVNPVYEITGIQKSLEGGPALLFEKIKGYPNVRHIANVFAGDERTAAIFGETEPKDLKFRILDAIKNPIPPNVIEQAPCQEVVVTENIDITATLPILKHSEADGKGHLFGGGVTLVAGLPGIKGSDLGFKRMNFRGKDWASLLYIPISFLGYLHSVAHKGEKMPLTVNICPPPATMIIAGGASIHAVEPYGADELGTAGALQGSPVEICKAKTVDAYAVANSEWVLEGYLTHERCFETDEAERIGQEIVSPFFPEFHGWLGGAGLGYKVEFTAITHRKESPIFFSPLASSLEGGGNLLLRVREANYYELAQRMAPGLVVDVNCPHFFTRAGVVFQVRKTEQFHDKMIKNILRAALAVGEGTIAMAVDEDIDIYSAEDLWWAVWTRANHEAGMFRGGGRPQKIGMYPAIALAKDTGLGIDATVSLADRGRYKRSHYPVDKVDLSKWFSEEELAAARRLQSPWGKVLGRIGG